MRAIYGPEGEAAALRLFRRLPLGRELGESAREVGEALSALAGGRLDSVALQSLGPAAFSLSLTVDGRELTIRLDRSGARIHSVGA